MPRYGTLITFLKEKGLRFWEKGGDIFNLRWGSMNLPSYNCSIKPPFSVVIVQVCLKKINKLFLCLRPSCGGSVQKNDGFLHHFLFWISRGLPNFTDSMDKSFASSQCAKDLEVHMKLINYDSWKLESCNISYDDMNHSEIFHVYDSL